MIARLRSERVNVRPLGLAALPLLDAGYDLAIRFGALADSSLFARQLAPNRRVICAAPAYLDVRGRPSSNDDLLQHDIVSFGDPPIYDLERYFHARQD
ncbi:LysR substrate-binding domain-containing protein [Rhizobium tubonense]|uniref:LysR substrate-binding domain-containing protein n=1 Tax=Rhizobium tubonense TaxID=484088 RepID=A0A2W4CSG8_9HYPH|nr:LysR substrate-binding domain-containing protein [Rhizobium tubonense]PZM08344.1 hypothetical protein CPY51_29410 [Rhizobium tubonense]